jgi:hypothetical protein
MSGAKFLAIERGAFEDEEPSAAEERRYDSPGEKRIDRFPLIEIARMDAFTRLILQEVYQQHF